jgi:hypothetical protein
VYFGEIRGERRKEQEIFSVFEEIRGRRRKEKGIFNVLGGTRGRTGCGFL